MHVTLMPACGMLQYIVFTTCRFPGERAYHWDSATSIVDSIQDFGLEVRSGDVLSSVYTVQKVCSQQTCRLKLDDEFHNVAV